MAKYALWHILSAAYERYARVAPVSTREELLNMDVNNSGPVAIPQNKAHFLSSIGVR